MAYEISTRISIRWLPDPPSEPTDTLVFNVGSYFVDLRILKADNSIEWAMAGEKQILSTEPLRCRWIKTIDSLGPSEPDEGSFIPLPNGDDLETGAMPCAEKGGAITEYEEIWRKVEPNPKVGRAWILQSSMDGKCFMGRIGGCFIVLNEGKKGFGARREEWDGEGRRWGRKYGIGDLEGMPTFLGVRGLEFDGEEGWKVGGNVEVQGVGFVILALEEL